MDATVTTNSGNSARPNFNLYYRTQIEVTRLQLHLKVTYGTDNSDYGDRGVHNSTRTASRMIISWLEAVTVLWWMLQSPIAAAKCKTQLELAITAHKVKCNDCPWTYRLRRELLPPLLVTIVYIIVPVPLPVTIISWSEEIEVWRWKPGRQPQRQQCQTKIELECPRETWWRLTAHSTSSFLRQCCRYYYRWPFPP